MQYHCGTVLDFGYFKDIAIVNAEESLQNRKYCKNSTGKSSF